MSSNRLTRYLPNVTHSSLRQPVLATGFVLVPNHMMSMSESSACVYQRAYLEARRNVARLRETRIAEAYRWN